MSGPRCARASIGLLSTLVVVALGAGSSCASFTAVQYAVGGKALHNRQLGVAPAEEAPGDELEVEWGLVGGEPALRCELTRHQPATRVTTRETGVCRGCYTAIGLSEGAVGGVVLGAGIASEDVPSTIAGAVLLADALATTILAATLPDAPEASTHLQPGYTNRLRMCPAGVTVEYAGRVMPVRARGVLHRDDAAWLVNTAVGSGGVVRIRFRGELVAELPADALGRAEVAAH